MITRRLIISLICAISSVGVIVILTITSGATKNLRGDFIRTINNEYINEVKTIDIQYNSYYIAGISESNLYLGNITSPFRILSMSTNLTDTQHFKIKLKHPARNIKSFQLKIFGNQFMMANGTNPSIYYGNIDNWSANKFQYDSSYFTEIIPLSNSSYILKLYSADKKRYVLGKETLTPPHISHNNDILVAQGDGMFSLDGSIAYNKITSSIIYVYRYRNEFIQIDSNLNIKSIGNTIDSNRIAKIQVTHDKIKNSHTLTGQINPINKKIDTYGDFLFINSNVLSKKENQYDFETSSVIDVYSISKNKYLFTFYIKDIKNEKISDFKIEKDQLIVINGKYLRLFKINENQLYRMRGPTNTTAEPT